MWDTGSQYTLVSSRIIKALGVHPYGRATVTGIGGNMEADTYLLHVALPSGDVIAFLEVLESDYDDYDVIIGMDVIGHGDFHVDNSSGHTIFSVSV